MASSAGNPTIWSPYDTYKDCSQGICSIYCPQWCYIIFPPPPPFDTGDDNDSTPNFSPLIIAVIGILGSAFLLVSYYTIISKYCKKVGTSDGDQNTSNAVELHLSQMNDGQLQPNQQQVGLDEWIIKSIAVYKFKKNDGVIDGVDCAVCLSEFQENESLRLLPKCRHAFHLPCIDTWLRSHPNCPLCRANVVPFAIPLSSQANSSTSFNVSSHQTTMQNDLVLVIENNEIVHRNVVLDVRENSSDEENQVEAGNVREIGRSNSMEPHLCQSHTLISDILNVSEDQEDLTVENCEAQMGNNSVSKQGGL